MSDNGLKELQRVRRVSDMMVTAHCYLGEHYLRLYILTDVMIFICSILLCVLAFVDRETLLNYLGQYYSYIIGIFSVATLIFAYASSKFDWKVKAVEHKNASQKYFEIKKECDALEKEISEGKTIDMNTVIRKHETCSNMLIKIPEDLFLKCKKHHLLKVEISKRLTDHPFTSIPLYKIKSWIKANVIKK